MTGIMTGILWIAISYLLGSFPSGYIFSRLSGKNILKIGWRKSSGSNVFKNVGVWQGVLTGILDVAKGYLAVLGAQKLGLPSEIQVFSGVAAVTGHNWSLFLRFAGGRGIGTFIGAFFALSPQVLGYSVIPLIVLAIIWDAAIGTLLFLALAIYFSISFNQFATAGFFTLITLLPIIIKRLSPVAEIRTTQNKIALIRNRLLFDDDEAHGFRVKRIFGKIKNNSGKAGQLVKPLAGSFSLSSKLGWQAAKYGVKMAKKPMGPVKEILSNGVKFLLQTPEKVVTEIKTDDFKKMMIASAKKIVLHQEEINKINVFPVADKDTGYNLAATLLGVEGVISRKNYLTFRELTQDIKEAVMINARGNAGMIYTGYMIEVLDRIKHLESIDAFHLSLAMERGVRAARLSVAEPVDGTILDVIKSAGDKAFEIAKMKKEKNIIKVLEEAHKVSEVSLKETKEKLLVLKENDVVDAGALGFVKILEAWIESLKGIPITARAEVTATILQPETKEKLKFKYEVVLSFKKNKETEPEKIKQELSLLGDSIDVVELAERIKIHLHTNQPDLVQEKFKEMSELESRVEDMGAQIKKTEKKPLGLVVDAIANLPKEFLEKYEIVEVPFTTKFPDGETITSKEEIYPKMKEVLKTGKSLSITLAPSFKEYLSAYQRALEKFEKILVITLSSKLSGAYSSARIARSIYQKPMKLKIYVFDCFTAEVGEGLVAMRAQELVLQGKKLEEIVEDLKEFCPKVILLGCLGDFQYVVRGGRFRLPKIFVIPLYFIQKMGIRLVVGLKNGKVKFFGVYFSKDTARILAKEIKRQSKDKEIRVAISHVDNLKEAQKLKEVLEKLPKVKVVFISAVSPVATTQTGPGALLVAFHPVDT